MNSLSSIPELNSIPTLSNSIILVCPVSTFTMRHTVYYVVVNYTFVCVVVVCIGKSSNEPNSKLRHKTKNGCVRRGTLVILVWATIGQKFLTRRNSTKNEYIVL